jgi:hypothetical protein
MTGQQVLDRWIAFVRRFVVLSDQQALVLALWAMHTWVYERFSATPYLEIVAPTKRSGKTTVLNLLRLLCRGSRQYAIVRFLSQLRIAASHEGKITYLVDEAEQFQNAALGEARQVLATGYTRGSVHEVVQGGETQTFPTFFPKAFALIGNVHDVLRDRCVEMELARGVPEMVLSEHGDAAAAEAEMMIADYLVWSQQAGRTPIVPTEWLRARERELWTPLWSVANWLHLHADTLRMLQMASVDMGLLKTLPAKRYHDTGEETEAEDRDMAERVLRDLESVVPEGETFVPSGVAVDRLRGIYTAPWRGWRGQGLNEVALAALLSRYGIAPTQKRVGKGTRAARPNPVRGYTREAIITALRKHHAA